METEESVFDKWKGSIKEEIDKCKTLEELKELMNHNLEWLDEEIEEEKRTSKTC